VGIVANFLDQFPSNRVATNVSDVLAVVIRATDAVIGKAGLPNFQRRPELFLRSEGETALNELNGTLQCHRRRDKNMEVLGHENKFVQKISSPTIGMQRLEKEVSPTLISKQSPPLPGLRGDKVSLAGADLLSSWSQIRTPSAAKAAPISDSYGAPEGAPLQFPFHSSIIFTKSLNR
jgi:hypothetical protein